MHGNFEYFDKWKRHDIRTSLISLRGRSLSAELQKNLLTRELKRDIIHQKWNSFPDLWFSYFCIFLFSSVVPPLIMCYFLLYTIPSISLLFYFLYYRLFSRIIDKRTSMRMFNSICKFFIYFVFFFFYFSRIKRFHAEVFNRPCLPRSWARSTSPSQSSFFWLVQDLFPLPPLFFIWDSGGMSRAAIRFPSCPFLSP